MIIIYMLRRFKWTPDHKNRIQIEVTDVCIQDEKATYSILIKYYIINKTLLDPLEY